MERIYQAVAPISVVGGRAPCAQIVPLDYGELHENRVILPNEAGPAAHAYRMLRTQLLGRTRAVQMRTIGIVSAADGEGKSLTAVNLALSIAAEPNQTVLLVDLDLHNPSIANLLGLAVPTGLEAWFEEETPSVSDLFVGLDGVLRLRVLPTMRPVRGSSELLARPRTHELFGELRGRYKDRLILIDLPPVLLSDDVLTIAPHLDGVLIVVAEARTKREDLARMRELLSAVPIVGSTLNRSSESERRRY